MSWWVRKGVVVAYRCADASGDTAAARRSMDRVDAFVPSAWPHGPRGMLLGNICTRKGKIGLRIHPQIEINILRAA